MSTAVVSTSAALGRPFIFDDEDGSNGCRASLDRTAEGGRPHMSQQETRESLIARVVQSTINQQSKIPPSSITPASQIEIRPAPEMVSSGIPAIDALTRWPSPWMPDRNLRPRLLGAHHSTSSRSGRRHSPRRILRGGGCQRRPRPSVCRRGRSGTGAVAVGAMRRGFATGSPKSEAK